jgi:hypothetical protein
MSLFLRFYVLSKDNVEQDPKDPSVPLHEVLGSRVATTAVLQYLVNAGKLPASPPTSLMVKLTHVAEAPTQIRSAGVGTVATEQHFRDSVTINAPSANGPDVFMPVTASLPNPSGQSEAIQFFLAFQTKNYSSHVLPNKFIGQVRDVADYNRRLSSLANYVVPVVVSPVQLRGRADTSNPSAFLHGSTVWRVDQKPANAKHPAVEWVATNARGLLPEYFFMWFNSSRSTV